MVDVGVGEKESEADLVEVVSARTCLFEEVPEECEGLVVTALGHVAAAESVSRGRRIAGRELARVERLLQQSNTGRDLAAA